MDFKLTNNQVTQIAKMLYLNLEEIKNYIETHQAKYNDFWEEEQKEENTKDNNFANSNALWQQYTDDTICKVNIDKNKMKGCE